MKTACLEPKELGIGAEKRLNQIFIDRKCPEDQKILIKKGNYLYCQKCGKIKGNWAERQGKI